MHKAPGPGSGCRRTCVCPMAFGYGSAVHEGLLLLYYYYTYKFFTSGFSQSVIRVVVSVSQSVSYIFSSHLRLIRCLATSRGQQPTQQPNVLPCNL